jgi:hypothetical protein
MTMDKLFEKHAFILGCERSGSTWVSNVLDTHPDIEFYMEPFADYAKIFPGFPDRNIHLLSSNNTLMKVVEDGYFGLPKIKYPLFYKRGRSLFLQSVDSTVRYIYLKTCRIINAFPGVKWNQFDLLRLHLSQVPISEQIKKNINSRLTVTKELRLNFKLGALNKSLPKAKYLITIRHPGAQISSILKLFKSGHLGELRRSLCSFLDSVYGGKRFNKYHGLQSIIDSNSEIEDILIVWWIVNYEILIEDCKLNGLDYQLIYHEDLSTDPAVGFEKIFSFLGLDYPEVVKQFVTTRSTKKNHTAQSAVDTRRDSATYFRNSILKVDPAISEKVQYFFGKINLIEELNRYRANF